MPATVAGEWVPWHLRLDAAASGFLYLNGHSLGRYWQAGPQREFFLPEYWLRFGAGQSNKLTLELRQTGGGPLLQSAVVEPYAGYQESR